MAKFRFHRGGLDESLKTEIEVKSLSDVEIASDKTLMGEYLQDFKCRYYGEDKRNIGYDNTYIITAYCTYVNVNADVVIGFSNQMLD